MFTGCEQDKVRIFLSTCNTSKVASGFSSSVTLNDDIMDKRSLERGFLLLDDDCFWMTMDFEGLIHATWGIIKN